MQRWDFGLQPEVAKDLWQQLYRPGTYMFASAEFPLTEDFISWGRGPQSSRADAFLAAPWPDYSYAFPPVPLISKCLAKLKQSSITVIIVTPVWKVAPWWDQLQELAQKSIYIGKSYIICRKRLDTRLPNLGCLEATVVQGKGHLLLSPLQQWDY